MEGHNCPWSNSAKYHGIVLDKRLTFAKHVDQTLFKTGLTIRALYGILNRRSRLTFANKLLVFRTVIRPTFGYGCQVWGNCATTHLRKLQVLQNKILKMCYNLPRDFSTRILHQETGIEMINIYFSRLIGRFFSACRSSEIGIIRNLV